MYDSVTAGDIPAAAELVAGYCDGIYRWSDADWARFPDVPKVRIAVSATTNDGHALDIEQGDATPDQAPGWVRARRAAGIPMPALYCARGARPAVEQYLAAAGFGRDQACIWLATLDGSTDPGAGAYPVIAVQYAGQPISGGHFDLSQVADHWPGVDPEEQEDMKGFIVIGSNGEQWAVLPTGQRFGIASAADLGALVASGQFVETGKQISDGQLAQWPIVGSALKVST